MDHFKNAFYQKALGWKPDQRGRVHVIFNCEDTAYQYWQSELLAYTYRKVQQPGPLTRLLSSDEDAKFAFSESTFKARSFSKHPRSGDKYLAYNKPASIIEWFKATDPKEKTIVVIDPDCIFLSKCVREVQQGKPAAQLYSYMAPDGGLGKLIISRHCRKNRNLVQPVGIPVAIHKDDLKNISPRWLEVTREIRDDRASHVAAGWIAEMFGYTIAAAELGLNHTIERLCVFPGENSIDAPFMHYCSPSEHKELGFHWHKGVYKPWEQPPMPPVGSPKAAIVLAETLREAAEVYGNAAMSPM
jgi:hypothetical protein